MSQTAMTLIAKVGKYVLRKNELMDARQRARSKANYYEKLFRWHGNKSDLTKYVRGFKKWNRFGTKRELKLLSKKHRIEQLKIEIEMHELVAEFYKEIYKIKKQLPYHLWSRPDKIAGLVLKEGGIQKMINLKELVDIVMADDIEKIILGKEA